MLVIVLYVAAAAALLGCGWSVSAWFHQRQIETLRLRLEHLKSTAAEHAAQARRQIGQLQADLASRPPARARPDRTAPLAAPIARAPERSGGDRDPVAASGFAPTEIGPNGFVPTRLLNPLH